MFLFTTLLVMLFVLSAIIAVVGVTGVIAVGLIFGDLIVFGLIIWLIIKGLVKK